MCLFACDLGFVVPEDLEVRDPADLKYHHVPVCGLAPGAVYDPGIFVTDSPALSRAASESRSRTAAWARGRCQGGAGRGRRQVLRKLSAAGRQRARPAAWHGGRRVARGDVRARGCCVCPCQPGLPVSVAAHSAATAMRAQRARFLPLPPPSLGTGGSRIAPPPVPAQGRSPEVVQRGRRRADSRSSRPRGPAGAEPAKVVDVKHQATGDAGNRGRNQRV